MDVGLYFSPEGASTEIGFKVLNDSHGGMGCMSYVFIIGQPAVGEFPRALFWWCTGGTTRCAGITHNRLECWVKADCLLYSESMTTSFWDDQFKGVADSRCIPFG